MDITSKGYLSTSFAGCAGGLGLGSDCEGEIESSRLKTAPCKSLLPKPVDCVESRGSELPLVLDFGNTPSNFEDTLPTLEQLSNIRVQMSNCRALSYRDVTRFVCIAAGLTLLFLDPVLSVNEYVRVIKGNVNIRSAPSTGSMTVGPAKQGDTFELVGEEGKWYEIDLFSGEQRFLHKSLATKVSFRPEVPEDAEIRRRIFREWNEAGNRAKAEADRKYPPERNLEKNLSHEQFLGDRFRLELLQKYGVQPPAYRRILIEGYQKGW